MVKITQCLHSYHKSSSSLHDEDEDSPVAGDEMSEYDVYEGLTSVTPPRTRRRNRDRKQKQRDNAG